MKKLIAAAVSAAIITTGAIAAHAAPTATVTYRYSAGEGKEYTREMEKLDRGLTAVKVNGGVYLSWRLFDSEDALFGSAEENVAFDIYRDGAKIATESDTTNYLDKSGTSSSIYSVVPAGQTPYTYAEYNEQSGLITGNTADNMAKVYAVKYGDGGVLSAVKVYEPQVTGPFEFEPDFVPDKVLMWNGMTPVNGVDAGEVRTQNSNYFDIPLEKPADATLLNIDTGEKESYSYTANDASCGDLDGDGEYEIILKWDCNGKDNSQGGYTGDVLLDAYKLDGTKLWRVNLGKNIRAGAHYTQFLVYDFDGDGLSEMICKTAPGSRDSEGKYVTQASHVDAIKEMTDEENEADFRNGAGYVLDGDEFLTVFDNNGRAVDTIYYPNQRVETHIWGDRHKNGSGEPEAGGNRVDRFTAAVAYMDGAKPYAVYMRGYYMRQNGGDSERQAACAVSFDGKQLECTHSFDTYDVNAYNDSRYGGKAGSSSYTADGTYKGVNGYVKGNEIYVGEGNHNCSVADVDNDGRDEVMTGAICYEFKDDGTLGVRWCTFMEHGDALHIGDYDPTHAGFEFFTVHEDGGPNTKSGKEVKIDFGMSVIDADSGEIMFHEGGGADTGRGVMANIGMGGYYQFWSAKNELRISNGGTHFTQGSKRGLSQNFRIFWDGDLYDELLDGTAITGWNGWGAESLFRADGCFAVNGTKNNPSLQADLFGDWREEVVYPVNGSGALRVFQTTEYTDYKIKTLMHDPVYRSGVSAEQTAYNQPPHVGIYMGEEIFDAPTERIEIISEPEKTSYAIGEELDATGLRVKAYLTDGTEKEVSVYTVSGYNPNITGEQTVTVTYLEKTAVFNVRVKNVSSITVTPPDKTVYAVGQGLSTAGLVVNITYEDGSEGTATDGYTIDGFNSAEAGEKEITVTYAGKSNTFTVEIIEGSILLLNGTYETTSTDSVLDEIPIGMYSGDFTIEHTVTINSIPANGNPNDRNSAAGFFMRFNPTDGVGGGWMINTNRWGIVSFVWKSSGNRGITLTNQNITAGETYTFRYDFTKVATGEGAAVDLTITDSSGNVVGSGSELNLRNMSNDNQKVSPLGVVQIYNQAVADREASVTIGDAKVVTNGEEDEPKEPEEPELTSFNVDVTVTDSNGTPVPDATVTLREVQNDSGGEDEGEEVILSSVNLSAQTDENGVAHFTDVPVGQYRIYATKSDLGVTKPQTARLQSVNSKFSYSVQFSKSL